MTAGLIYSNAYGESLGEGVCRVCGGPAATATPRIYCCRKHKRRAAQSRRVNPDWTPKFAGAGEGICPHCGETFQPRPRFQTTCGAEACVEALGDRGFWRFKQAVKWPHSLGWLGPKLKLEPDDPRLPEVAKALAEKGLLVVYIRADGTVGEVGRPKP